MRKKAKEKEEGAEKKVNKKFKFKEKTPFGDNAVNWFFGIFKNSEPSTESETLRKYKEKENLIRREQFKPIGEETVNKIFNQLGIDPKKLGNINIFGPEKNKDNISDMNKDTFVPIRG